MTYIEYKGKRYKVIPAKGDAWSNPCDYCCFRFLSECIITFAFCDDYYPKRVIFEKL